MNNDYIEREAAEDVIADIINNPIEDGFRDSIEILSRIHMLPTSDVRPVVRGRWVDNGIPESILSGCSVCGYTCGSSSMNFCPNCGADMREVDDED